MSYIAAVLLLNMDGPDAFVCFANLLNQPFLLAFFRHHESLVCLLGPAMNRAVLNGTRLNSVQLFAIIFFIRVLIFMKLAS